MENNKGLVEVKFVCNRRNVSEFTRSVPSYVKIAIKPIGVPSAIDIILNYFEPTDEGENFKTASEIGVVCGIPPVSAGMALSELGFLSKWKRHPLLKGAKAGLSLMTPQKVYLIKQIKQ